MPYLTSQREGRSVVETPVAQLDRLKGWEVLQCQGTVIGERLLARLDRQEFGTIRNTPTAIASSTVPERVPVLAAGEAVVANHHRDQLLQPVHREETNVAKAVVPNHHSLQSREIQQLHLRCLQITAGAVFHRQFFNG